MSKRDRVSRLFRHAGVTAVLEHARRKPCLIVLTYHRIGDMLDSPYDHGVFSATPDRFDEQLSYLKRHFTILTFEETRELAVLRRPLRRGGVLITFDDGYADNYRNAFPILHSHGIEATFFLCTSLVGATCVPWWDQIAYCLKHTKKSRLSLSYPYLMDLDLSRSSMASIIQHVLRAYKSPAMLDPSRFMSGVEKACDTALPNMDCELFMSWQQAREMSSAGMAIGSHAHSHSLLAKLPEREQRWEAQVSKQILENELQQPIASFAYPCGSLSPRTSAVLAECGYEVAFAFSGGVNVRGKMDPLRIKRISIESDVSFDQFRVNTLLAAVTGKDLSGNSAVDVDTETVRQRLEIQICRWDEWLAVERTWATLVDASPYASFFHSSVWIRTWIEVFGPVLHPTILFFRSERQAVAACVLVHRTQRRGPISLRRIYLNTSGEDEIEETSLEFNDLLCRAGYEATAAEALRRYLDTQSWDEFIIPGCSRTAASEALKVAFNEFEATHESQPSFYIDLEEIRKTGVSFDMSLSAKNRYHIRQSVRAYESDKPLTVEYASDRARAQELFAQMAELHQRHWTSFARVGAFHSARFVRFHQLLIDRAFDRDHIQIMGVRHGQQLVGCLYNFGWRGKVYFYQCGFRYSDNKRLRPGLVTIRLAIDEMLKRGCAEFDLMAGDVEYKRGFSKRSRNLDWTTFSRPTARTALLRVLLKARKQITRIGFHLSDHLRRPRRIK